MILQRFEVPGLAHYSYLIASEGQAIVIDPQRDAAVYLEFARTKGLMIAHILEAHIHADCAFGAPALGEVTGAKLWLSAYDKDEQYQYGMPHATLTDSAFSLVRSGVRTCSGKLRSNLSRHSFSRAHSPRGWISLQCRYRGMAGVDGWL